MLIKMWTIDPKGIAGHHTLTSFSSEFLQQKLNIKTSGRDFTPTEAEKLILHLMEGGTLKIDKA